MASKYQYFLTIEYVIPKTGRTYFKKLGPVRSRKIIDTLYLFVIKKRNVINIKTEKEPYEH